MRLEKNSNMFSKQIIIGIDGGYNRSKRWYFSGGLDLVHFR